MNMEPNNSTDRPPAGANPDAGHPEERQVIRCTLFPRRRSAVSDVELLDRIQRLLALSDQRGYAMTASINTEPVGEGPERRSVVVTGAVKQGAVDPSTSNLLQGFFGVVTEVFPDRKWNVEELTVQRASVFRLHMRSARSRSTEGRDLLRAEDIAAWIRDRHSAWSNPAMNEWLQSLIRLSSAPSGVRAYVNKSDLEHILEAGGPTMGFGASR